MDLGAVAAAVSSAVGAADLESICEALHATQQSDGDARKKAEQKLDDAASSSPNHLVSALCQVLGAGESTPQITKEIRQEAAVILRQLVVGIATRSSVWAELQPATQKAFMVQMLQSFEADPAPVVKRAAGQVASEIAALLADDFDELQKEWPEILPLLSRLSAEQSAPETRVSALNMLTLLVPTIGVGMLAQGNHAINMLGSSLTPNTPPQVGAAGAQLVMSLVEELPEEALTRVAEVMPALLNMLKTLANPSHEELLKSTLESLISSAEETPEFYKTSNSVEGLCEILLKICAAGAGAFDDEDVRQSAMEAVMSLVIGLRDDVVKPEGLPLLETVVGLNMAWMFEVEEDVDMWTEAGREKDEDDCDDDVVGIAEENMDRLGENFDEEVLMPVLFKTIRGVMSLPDATWKTARAGVMALAQIAEHLEEESWVDETVNFIIQHLSHAHPRVRYAAFWAVGQVCYDQSPHVQETHCKALLPATVKGIDDQNVRVATAAVASFSALGEELEAEDLEADMDDMLMRFFNRLHAAESQAMQEHCLSAIAVVAEASDDMFTPYYKDVMPMLKALVSRTPTEEQRSLHGKAFECIAVIGGVVGKEIFLIDAQEIMGAMMPMMKDGFDADDPRREAFHEASGKIAETLGKDFKPYVQALLPSIFKVLDQKLGEEPNLDDLEDIDDLDELEGLVGGNTSVSEEIEEALELTDTLVEALGEEFCEFVPAACQKLLPLLDQTLGDSLLQQVFKTWGEIAKCVRLAATNGRIQPTVLRELVTELLKKTVASLVQMKPDDLKSERECGRAQARAAGAATVIKHAGEGVLTKEGVKDIALVILKLLDSITLPADTAAEPGLHRRRGGPANNEDSDDEEEADDSTPVTAQSVRFALCDLAGALMRSNREDFIEVALPTFIEAVKLLCGAGQGESNQSLGFYLTDDIVNCLGDKSVPHWNAFMNQALIGMLDKSSLVRQFSTSTIGHATKFPQFAACAAAAASSVHQVIQKHGERHKRRRAVQKKDKAVALAVDAAIHTLGQICEYHGATLGPQVAQAWSMWLGSLPLKTNVEAAQATHTQLVRLITQGHPVLTSPEQLPRVLGVFADIYRNHNLSSTLLDAEVAKGVANLGESRLAELCGSFPERQKKKVEMMLKSIAKSGAEANNLS